MVLREAPSSTTEGKVLSPVLTGDREEKYSIKNQWNKIISHN
jgi:hypothetical protein